MERGISTTLKEDLLTFGQERGWTYQEPDFSQITQQQVNFYNKKYNVTNLTKENVQTIINVEAQARLCEQCKGLKKCPQQMSGFYPIYREHKGELYYIVKECRLKGVDRQQRRLRSLIRTAGIPAVYESKTWRDYETRENGAAIEAAKRARGSVYIFGEPRVGKTFMASLLAKDYLEAGFSVMFVTAPELALSLSPDNPRKYELQQELIEVPVLVIDDFGAERSSEYVSEQMFIVVDGRTRSLRKTVWTSNVSPEELKGINGARIAARIRESAALVWLK